MCVTNNHWELQGLVSWGDNENCGQITKIPGIYANIPHLFDWIRKSIESESQLDLLSLFGETNC